MSLFAYIIRRRKTRTSLDDFATAVAAGMLDGLSRRACPPDFVERLEAGYKEQIKRTTEKIDKINGDFDFTYTRDLSAPEFECHTRDTQSIVDDSLGITDHRTSVTFFILWAAALYYAYEQNEGMRINGIDISRKEIRAAVERVEKGGSLSSLLDEYAYNKPRARVTLAQAYN